MVKDAVKVLHLSGGLWKRIKWNGRVTVNGEEVHNARRRVAKGDRIVLTWSEENDIVPSDIPLSIMYEDEALLVVNKGPGMIIHPTARGAHDTLVNAVAGYYAQRRIEAGIHPIYRLDRNTTGLVVVAKSAKGQYDLSKSHDQIYREYLALVSGHMDEKAGRIDRPIGRRDGSIVEWMVREDGKRAITDYEVLGEYEGYSLLKIHLLTGRTHQIRVHFAAGTSRLYRPLRSSGDGKGNEIHRSRAGGYEEMDGEIKGAAGSVCYNKKTYFPFYSHRKVALGL